MIGRRAGPLGDLAVLEKRFSTARIFELIHSALEHL
jgi:hypothetical protein